VVSSARTAAGSARALSAVALGQLGAELSAFGLCGQGVGGGARWCQAARCVAADAEGVRQDLSIAESQLRDYQARLGKPFLHDAYLSELTNLRDQLKSGLSATAPTQADEAGAGVSKLADRIKSLKAANTIEATPQRVRQKQSTAEEPVTARIRRRTEASAASDQEIESDAASGKMAGPARESVHDSSAKPPMTFPERIAMERQRKDQEPRMS
jgi:hypothetical protein